MESPIEVLRIEQNVVSKELNRFRACDQVTRSFYCREWAQYIYKKHFVWSAKTQDDMQDQGQMQTLSTGSYNICMLQHAASNAKRKERSPKLSEQFDMLLDAKSREETKCQNAIDDDNEAHIDSNPCFNESTLTQDIIQACMLWQTLPSSLSGLPSIFEPVQFNPFPDAIPLDDDIKAPAQLLEPLIIERQALCLPSEGFHLLKNLTGDIFISHSQPTCHHIKPDDPSPSDLETQRQILNEDLVNVTSKVLETMDKRLATSWRPLLDFLFYLSQLEERRNQLMGQRCQAYVDEFVTSQGVKSFADMWKLVPTNKIDRAKLINAYLVDLVDQVRGFLQEFVIPRLAKIGKLIQDLWDLVGPTIQHMAERMACHEERDRGSAENCKAVSQSLKGLYSTKEVDEAIDRIKRAMAERVEEYIEQVNQVKDMIDQPFQQGDNALKKKIKRLESGYYSLRQFFRYEVTQKIFPETLFCKFTLVCLGALMQEGEVMEAMIIETEVKSFIESHRDLVKRRQSLVLQYEEGVQFGRRELAGILGKLFLKEGMRIKGETVALKRQNMLLKSIGVSEDTKLDPITPSVTSNKKKKKKKKKGAAPPVSSSSSLPVPLGNGNSSKGEECTVLLDEIQSHSTAIAAPVAEANYCLPAESVSTLSGEVHAAEITSPPHSKKNKIVAAPLPTKSREESNLVPPITQPDTKPVVAVTEVPPSSTALTQSPSLTQRIPSNYGQTPLSPPPLLAEDTMDLLKTVEKLQKEKLFLEHATQSLQQELTTAKAKCDDLMALQYQKQQYIEQLETQLKQYQLPSSRPPITSPTSRLSFYTSPPNHSWVTAGFGNQDLFEGIRLQMQFPSSPHNHPF
ncbi:hypothetical protein DM01DRAFT_1404128 [Hesseltinella vesiculosa]|uniref:Uncharacterized protein n=1 Tax=Hesseltinella vesiculosa TaxID=101127 RepID=A0A1X2GTF6_9FUNG|nr:hypothetical protein DM01DRAFT_1404128 [Hesseltinella vesiculosa]